jgi:hypothetical protein
MPLYTFIPDDYKGGTYISQVEALSEKAARVKWAKNLEASEIHGFGESSGEKLIAEMKEKEPALLNALTNVRCVSALIRGELALINFVRTEKGADNEQPTTNN